MLAPIISIPKSEDVGPINQLLSLWYSTRDTSGRKDKNLFLPCGTQKEQTRQ